MKRIWHNWEKWECYKAGFYDSQKIKKEEGEEIYREFLSDLDKFENALKCIIVEWEYSCEHFLTNDSLNRIAWLGQASLAYSKGLPCWFRGGFKLLTTEQQIKADRMAEKYLYKWIRDYESKDSQLYFNLDG